MVGFWMMYSNLFLSVIDVNIPRRDGITGKKEYDRAFREHSVYSKVGVMILQDFFSIFTYAFQREKLIHRFSGPLEKREVS